MSETFKVTNYTFSVDDDKFSKFISTLKSKCRINSYEYSYTYEKNKDKDKNYNIFVAFTETINSHNRNNQFDDIMYPLSFFCEYILFYLKSNCV